MMMVQRMHGCSKGGDARKSAAPSPALMEYPGGVFPQSPVEQLAMLSNFAIKSPHNCHIGSILNQQE